MPIKRVSKGRVTAKNRQKKASLKKMAKPTKVSAVKNRKLVEVIVPKILRY